MGEDYPCWYTKHVTLQVRPFVEADEAQVVDLWERCGLVRAWNDPRKDIARKLRVQRELFLVGLGGDGGARIVGTVMAGYDGHRGWINYLAVDPEYRRQGFARALMGTAEDRLRALGCAKINLQIRHDNVDAMAFYRRIGFADDAAVSMGKRLERDDG
jgi:ribosomal protein S18 acetylase RimI-like enzyme